jgi:membrane-bound lytic murein transglycosylase F
MSETQSTNIGLTAPIAFIFALVAGAPFFLLDHEPVEHAKPDAHAEPDAHAAVQPDEKLDKALKGSTHYTETGDLDALRARKRIRFLVFGDEQQLLQRNVRSKSEDRVQARKFAMELGLVPEFVRVPRFGDLRPWLLEGKGDVIATRMTVTEERAKEVAFTTPTAVVKEVIVQKKGDAAIKKLEDLVGKDVHVWPHSSYEGTLKELPDTQRPNIVQLPAVGVDDPTVIHRVATGEYPYGLIDDDIVEACLSYEAGAEAGIVVKEGAQIAWAVRPSAKQLLEKANAFLTARSLTGHTEEAHKGDLDEIQKRGTLRVITRNNPVTYFLHKGKQYGFDYELATLIAKHMGVRLEIVVPPTFGEMITYLNDGKGDFIAGQLTETPERANEVGFTLPYIYVNEILVKKKGAPAVASLDDLKGKTVHVREQSSYNRTMQKLKAKHGFSVQFVPENMETEAILAKVASGEIEFTVSDDTILNTEIAYGRGVEPALQLTEAAADAKDIIGKATEGGEHIAFAVRKENKKLLEWLNAWVNKNYRGIDYNVLKKRYFDNARQISAAHERTAESGKLSPYDDLLHKYAQHYGLDWRLMAAQAYQESRFNPAAVSWVGAQGLFQVMPATGRELGFTELHDPEIGIHAGVKYMAQLIGQFEDTLPYKERVRFALASYNAGRGHVLDARRLAKRQGWDPNKWFGNVEKAMLLLQQRKYAKHARHGYCRGEEPVTYVSNIQSKYDAFSKLVK